MGRLMSRYGALASFTRFIHRSRRAQKKKKKKQFFCRLEESEALTANASSLLSSPIVFISHVAWRDDEIMKKKRKTKIMGEVVAENEKQGGEHRGPLSSCRCFGRRGGASVFCKSAIGTQIGTGPLLKMTQVQQVP